MVCLCCKRATAWKQCPGSPVSELLLICSEKLKTRRAEQVEEVDTDDIITSRSAHYLSTPVSQMREADLQHLQGGRRSRPLLVRLLARWRQTALGLYWQDSASGGERR